MSIPWKRGEYADHPPGVEPMVMLEFERRTEDSEEGNLLANMPKRLMPEFAEIMAVRGTAFLYQVSGAVEWWNFERVGMVWIYPDDHEAYSFSEGRVVSRVSRTYDADLQSATQDAT